jgi:hypothetical protein
MKKIIIPFIAIALFSACFKKKNPKESAQKTTFTNTCEPNQIWLNEYTIREVGTEAHSGIRASVMTDKDEFGLGVVIPINKVLDKNQLKKVNVSAWVKAANLPLKASFVFSVDADKNLFWTAQALKDMIKETNKWTYIQFKKDIPKNDNPQARLSAYFYNNLKENLMVDDLEITFEGQ